MTNNEQYQALLRYTLEKTLHLSLDKATFAKYIYNHPEIITLCTKYIDHRQLWFKTSKPALGKFQITRYKKDNKFIWRFTYINHGITSLLDIDVNDNNDEQWNKLQWIISIMPYERSV